MEAAVYAREHRRIHQPHGRIGQLGQLRCAVAEMRGRAQKDAVGAQQFLRAHRRENRTGTARLVGRFQIAANQHAFLPEPAQHAGAVRGRERFQRDDVAEQLPIVFDDPEEDTIGGYVFGLLGRKPEIGDAVEISGYSFKVLRTEGFRVVRVLAAKLPQEQEQKEEQQDE